jgi:hypothetical protein
MREDRWIELRLAALDTAAALDPAGLGVDLGAALADPDPAFRRAAATLAPLPAAASVHRALADAVTHDVDPEVALGAAQSLCLSIDGAATARPILDALGPAGLARIRTLVTAPPELPGARDLARCLIADGTPESAAALRAAPRR